VDVVPNLLAPEAEHRVGRPGDGALHQVGEEAVELGSGVRGTGDAAAAEADGRDVEVAPVLLDQQVRRRLGDTEEGVRGAVDRHRRVDAGVVAMVHGQLEPALALLERQPVGRVPIDLVRGTEDERRLGRHPSGRLEQIEGSGGVDGEIEPGDRARPSRATAGPPRGRRARPGPPGRKARSTAPASRTSTSSERNPGWSSSSSSVTCPVEASGPKKVARRSFSRPITSQPSSARPRTDSDPISPPEPVTIATMATD